LIALVNRNKLKESKLMAKKSKKGKSEDNKFNVSLSALTVRSVAKNAILLEQRDDALIIKEKKQKSSKWIRRVLPYSTLLRFSIFEENQIEYTLKPKQTEILSVFGAVSFEGGFVRVETEDGLHFISEEDASVESDPEDGEKIKRRSKRKASKTKEEKGGKKRGRKAKDEDVDEEEFDDDAEEDDDDEEEEDSKSSKRGSKKTKKSKAKKVEEVSEDDDDEESEDDDDEESEDDDDEESEDDDDAFDDDEDEEEEKPKKGKGKGKTKGKKGRK
jgi:hypothetical protein